MPVNETHVQRELRMRIFATDDLPPDPPEISEALLQWLEAMHPPRCYTGADGETLEQHLLYAGQVDLIQRLRAVQTSRLNTDDDNAPLTDEELANLAGTGDGATTVHQT